MFEMKQQGRAFADYSRPRKASGLLLVLVLAGVVCASAGSSTDMAGKTPAGQDEVVPLPRGMDPTGIFTTDSPFFVIKAANDAYHRSVYSWQPGNTPVLIIEGSDLDLTRLSDNTFAVWFSDGHQEQIVTLNENKVISRPLVLPNGGPRGWRACEGDSHYVVCMGDRPGMKEQDRDYDEMGFTAVLVVELATRKINWFPVGDRTRIRFDRKHEMIYVVDWDSASSHGPVEAFDLAGKDRGPAPWREILPSSPAGQYVESLAEDGSESWEVSEASTMAPLLRFNCEQAGCREGDNYEALWNPKFTDQIVAIRIGGAYGKGGACDIYQLSPPRPLKTVPCVGLPDYDWSRNGRELITLTGEGNILLREPVN
jgi:hypothetical protein